MILKKGGEYLIYVSSLSCTLSCKDGLWSLTSASGTIRLENTDVLLPHLLSNKKRKCYLIAHSRDSGTNLSSLL